MDTMKYGVQETAKDAFQKHLFVRVYSNLSTLRLERILTMVYVVQNYWAYYGLYPVIETSSF
jgi:hypothetical protein